MTTADIALLVAFLRGGGVAATRLSGNPSKGRTLFYGKGKCVECHMVNGRGGFLANDLSGYGRAHSPAEIKNNILHPARNTSRTLRSVSVRTKDAKQYSGVVRNEDNFSIQLLDSRGVFHLFMKADLAALERESPPVMPEDYGSRLTTEDLNDLVAFLTHSGR